MPVDVFVSNVIRSEESRTFDGKVLVETLTIRRCHYIVSVHPLVPYMFPLFTIYLLLGRITQSDERERGHTGETGKNASKTLVVYVSTDFRLTAK